MTQPSCRKCPYFERSERKEPLFQGSVIVGFCRLRQMHITDVTITREHCKDRAVVSLPAQQKTPTNSVADSSEGDAK
jgi:hypothetical protein